MINLFKGKIKKEYLLVGILIIAVILITVTAFTQKDTTSSVTETDKYVEQIEKKLERSILKIDGVKSVEVALKVDSGITTVIANDEKKIDENGKVTYTSTPVLVSGKPIILGEIYPEITGIVIVCDCKDQVKTRLAILDVVTTMLDLPCDKVRILTQ